MKTFIIFNAVINLTNIFSEYQELKMFYIMFISKNTIVSGKIFHGSPTVCLFTMNHDFNSSTCSSLASFESFHSVLYFIVMGDQRLHVYFTRCN